MATKKIKAAPVAAPAAVTSAPADAATTTTLEPVQLTVADLQVLSRIVDLASRRGAFQAGELSQVGDAFNKLTSFLNYVEAAQAKEAQANGTAAPVATPTPAAA